MLGVGVVVASVGVVLPVAAGGGVVLAQEEPVEEPERHEVALIESPPLEVVEPVVPEGRFGPEPEVPEAVTELVEARSARGEVWVNEDGSRTARSFVVPRYFQAEGSSEWLPIDSTLVVDEARPGWVRSAANDWAVWFGPSGAAEGMQQVEFDGAVISFVPVGGDPGVVPVTEGSTATYVGLWPGVDVEYVVSGLGVEERIVLGSAEAASSFAFEVVGATPRLDGAGGVELLVDEVVVASVPPLVIETASGDVLAPEGVCPILCVSGRGGHWFRGVG